MSSVTSPLTAPKQPVDMYAQLNKEEKGSGAETANQLSLRTRKKTTGKSQLAYGGFASSGAQHALSRALREISARNGGKVTFAAIREHQQQLEEKFIAKSRVELAKLGVPADVEFTLTLHRDGDISVACEDRAAKATIQSYLERSPEMREQFTYIQSLANLERARRNASGTTGHSLEAVKAQLQASAVEAFFEASLASGMGYAPVSAMYSSAGASFFSGLDARV